MVKARNNNVVLIKIETEQQGLIYNSFLPSKYQVIDVGPDVKGLEEKEIVVLNGEYRYTTVDNQDLYILSEDKVIAVIQDAT